MKNILIVPPKTIDQLQKDHLQKQGVIIVEAADPDKVRLLQPEFDVPVNDLIIALLEGVNSDTGRAQSIFVNRLLERLKNF